MSRSFVFISMILVFTTAGASQDVSRPKPLFAVAVRAERVVSRVGSPTPVKLTLTNTSGRDLHLSVMAVQCRPLINVPVTVRQVQLQIYDSEGKRVPLTFYGEVVQGRVDADREQTGAHEQGVGCGWSGTLDVLKSGESRTEEADLSKEFDIKKPGTYTLRAQKLDNENKAVVKSEAVTVTFTAAQ